MRSPIVAALSLLAALSCVAACGAPETPPEPNRPEAGEPEPTGCERRPGEAPRACAMATFDGAAGVMEVRLEIPPEALPEAREDVQLRFRERYFGDAYAATFVERIDGEAWPASFGDARAPIVLHYRVALDFFERGEPRYGRGGISWQRPGGWHLTGKTFLPDVWVDGSSVKVPSTLHLDVGEQPLWTAAGPEARVFDAESLIALADTVYEVGTLTATQRTIGSRSLWVGASGDVDEARLGRWADTMAQAFARIEARLGPPEADALLYVFHPIGPENHQGERLGASLVHLGPTLPLDPIYGHGAVTFHELIHQWNPGRHVIFEDWIEEGFTDLLAIQVAGELAEAGDAAHARVLLRRYDAFAAGAGERTVREPNPDDARWVYDAGIVTGFCLDAQLREAGSSLWAVLRAMLNRPEEELGTEALLEDVAAVAPAAASYLEVRAGTAGAFAVDDCFEAFGFEVRPATFEGPTDRALALDVLGIGGLQTATHTQSFDVAAVRGDTPLEVGDTVLQVAEHPVADLADVAWALRNVEPGERFPIRLRRGGEERVVERTRPALGADALTERSYRELVPREGGAP